MHQNNERFTEIISSAAEKRGLYSVHAEFIPTKDFKISWKTIGKELKVYVSDYISDAPSEVLIGLSETILDIVKRQPYRYEKTYLDWITSDEFIIKSRQTYIRRSKNLARTPEGRERNLTDSLDKLLESGILTGKDLDNSFFTWTSRPNYRKVGYCSPMMRLVAVSSALDTLTVPDYVVDYVVYHESLHLRQGYRPGKRAHDVSFRNAEKEFPDYKKAEVYLKTLKDRM